MKLSTEAIVAPEKILRYLLLWQPENDKSQFLAQAGYTTENWEQLATDLREQFLSREAILAKKTPYGDMYEISGSLTGPHGKSLRIITIWMTEQATQQTKFITLFPDKR